MFFTPVDKITYNDSLDAWDPMGFPINIVSIVISLEIGSKIVNEV